MSPKIHIPCGIISGGIIFAFSNSLCLSLACCFSNFIFDFDHVLEYICYCLKYKKEPSLHIFFSGSYFTEKGTIAVIFHGYEYVLLFLMLAICSFFINQLIFFIFLGTLIGYSEHMILDLIGNDCSFKGYSILYRKSINFKLELICNKKRKH